MPVIHTLRLSRKARFALLIVLVVSISLTYQAAAAPLTQTPDEGRALFEKKCTGCHTIGGGKKIGPDLQGVTTRRERAWLLRWISTPDQVLASGDPIATKLFQEHNQVAMPNLRLTQPQVESLIAYFEAIDSGAIAPPATQAATALAQGNAANGRELFTGSIRLQNAGPPCLGCHSVGGIGALGGGVLGPDLTPAYTKFGDVGLASMLQTIPMPTMNPIFGPQGLHPLTPQEQADLRVFLQAVSVAERPADAVVQLALLSAIGATVLLVLAQVLWRKRLVAVRRPLVTRARLASGSRQAAQR